MPIPLGVLAVAGAGAAGGAGAYELIQSQVLSTATASVTFSSIPQTYKHLQLRMVTRTTRSSNLDELNVRINSDTGANYRMHELVGDGSSVSSSSSALTGRVSNLLTVGNNSTANIFSASVMDILDYTSSSKNSVTRTLHGELTSYSVVQLQSGLWVNTNAITNLYIYATNGPNFAIGSRFSLYGIKG